MKKIIFYITLTILLYFSIYNNSKCTDSIYVAPSELEDGWGLYCFDPGNEMCDGINPKSLIYFLQVSPDGNWLFFEDSNKGSFKLLNLKTKEISLIEFVVNALWLPNSRDFYYAHPGSKYSIFYNIYNQKRDTLSCINSYPECGIGGFIGPDGNMYFPSPGGYNGSKLDTILYRINIDSSRVSHHPYYEMIGNKDTINYYWPPIFPPNTIHYYVNKYPRDGTETEGFDVTTDFNYASRREVRINSPDTNWVFSGCNNYAGSLGFTLKQIEAGPRGEVYCYLSFRSKKDISNKCKPAYWDSSTIAARNASGWYRVDTSGNNLVQLVRSWSYGMGGISITSDGETIYYGMLNKDTNAAIYRMNRFGKNKELVINLGNMSGFTKVNEDKDQNNNLLKSIIVDDVSEITLKFDKFIGKPATISIYDIWGREIIQEIYQIIDKEVKINVSGLPNGFYIISCSDNISIDFYKMLKD